MENVEWCSHYQQVTVHVLAARSSNHHPILSVFQDRNYRRTSYRRGFKFEAGWLKDPEFLELIHDEWDMGGGVWDDSMREDIEATLEREDTKWKQTAKRHWFQHGDRNTRYFHTWANHRKKINTICTITDDNGRVWRKKEDVSQVFIEYYQNLFSSQGPSGVDACLEFVERRVTNAMNERLLHPFEEAGDVPNPCP
jgi:hypothetical protein